MEIFAQGPEGRQAYFKALNEGETTPLRSKLMLVGPAGVGKSNLCNSLTDQPFVNEHIVTDCMNISDVKVMPWKLYSEIGKLQSDKIIAIAQQIIEKLKQSNHSNTSNTNEEASQEVARSNANTQVPKAAEDIPPQSKFVELTITTINERKEEIKAQLNPENSYEANKELDEAIALVIQSLRCKTENEHFTLDLWDFGGQEVYYTVHHLFLTERAIYLVVFNMEDATGPFSDPMNKDWLKNLFFWINSIHTHAPSSPIFLIGTHKDKIPANEQWKQISDTLKADLFPNKNKGSGPPQHPPVFRQIIRNFTENGILFYPVDNTLGGDDGGVKQLHEEIDKCLKHERVEGILKDMIPTKWLVFQEEILKKKTDNHITLTNARDIAKQCNIVDDKQFNSMMKFFHDIGVLIHYNEGQLRDMVITNPQWLVNVIRCVITVEQYWSERGLDAEAIETIKSGYFRKDILHRLWSNSNHVDQFIELLGKFGLMEKYDTDYFVVPSLLPKKPAQWNFDINLDLSCYLVFDNYLPRGLFHYLSIYCIQESKNSGFEYNFLSYNSCMALLKEQQVLLEQLDNHPMIKVTIRMRDTKKPRDALTIVTKKVDKLQQAWMTGLKYSVKLPCPHCNSSNGGCFFSFTSPSPALCSMDYYQVELKDIISGWDGLAIAGARNERTLCDVPTFKRAEIAHRISMDTNWSLLGLYFEIELGIALSREWLVAAFKEKPDKELCRLLLEEFAKRALLIRSFRKVLESPNFGMKAIVADFPELQV
jgi:GTPase SAR1 family protein